ncbi:MAG: PPK2 family polyphosphate kinase [Puniceicoccaceae bacterium]
MKLADLVIREPRKVSLGEWDPNDRMGYTDPKEELEGRFLEVCHELANLQRDVFVNKQYKVLIVLQGMDTSGKNGTIRKVFRMTDPTGVQVASFGKPTPLELAHDYLWRIHACCPANGETVIFDRSHYEDISAVAVNRLVPEERWRKRFDHLNDFEKMLADEGTIILKFFLHIDLDEQKERLQARLDDPKKHWKFDTSDLVARKRWDEYMAIYEEIFSRTSFPHAPWYIIPSNRKWLRNLLVAESIVACLKKLDLSPPKVLFDPESIDIE